MTLPQFHELTRAELEQTRLAAAVDLAAGMKQSKVARKYRVTRTTVCRWRRRLEAGGKEALRLRKASGRPCRLTEAQLAEVAAMRTPQIALFDGAPPVRKVKLAVVRLQIESRFGVLYDVDHVSRMLLNYDVRQKAEGAKS